MVTTFTLLETNPGSSVPEGEVQFLQHPVPRTLIFLNTTILISVLATISTHTQMEAQTRGPWLIPPKLVGRRGLHIPHRTEARSFLVQEVKNSHLGGENETKHHNHSGLSSPPFSILSPVTPILHHHLNISHLFPQQISIVQLCM